MSAPTVALKTTISHEKTARGKVKFETTTTLVLSKFVERGGDDGKGAWVTMTLYADELDDLREGLRMFDERLGKVPA